MESRLLNIFMAVSLFLMNVNAVAQNIKDTIIYSEEREMIDSALSFKKWYSDFTQQMVEEKSLFKFGINDLVHSNDPFDSDEAIEERLSMIMFGAGIEQKINPGWSILFEWRTSYEKYTYHWDNYVSGLHMKVNGREYNSSKQEYIEAFNLNEFDLGVRHYFNLKKRISVGECANNFSSNFLVFKFSHRAYLKDSYTYTWREDKDVFSKIVFGFGLQRRLSKYGFIDLYFGSSIDIYKTGGAKVMSIPLAEKVFLKPFCFSFNIGFGL